MKKFLLFLLTICMLSSLVGCSIKPTIKENVKADKPYNEIIKENIESNTKEETINKEKLEIEDEDVIIEEIEKESIEEKLEVEIESSPIEVSLVAVGDNLIHTSLIKAGKNDDGTYNYDFMYEEIAYLLENKDIKAINQETILINDRNQYSGYPTFGSPIEIGEALINVGFNVVTHATNHTYDKKIQGILDSYNFWKQYENVTTLGIHNSEEDFNKKNIVDYNGIKIGMLNYTYGLNGFVLPDDKQFLTNTLYDEEKIKIDIEELKKECDFVIVFPHWGTEYTHKETSYQTNLANLMANAGADLIIGTHPHVIEPVKEIIQENGRKTVCYYSLGNFISSQDEIPRMLGAMARVTIVKDGDNTYIKYYDAIPLVTHLEKKPKVYALENYTEELCSSHKLKNKGISIDKLKSIWNEVFSQFPIE